MKNYHILKVTHVAPNNRNYEARVRIKSDLQRQSITIPYTNEPSELGNPRIEAIKWLEKNGFPIIGYGEVKDHYIIIVNAVDNEFKRLKP